MKEPIERLRATSADFAKLHLIIANDVAKSDEALRLLTAIENRVRDVLAVEPPGDAAGMVESLEERYAAPVIPPCVVCGAPLAMQSCGGGEPTRWACSAISLVGTTSETRKAFWDHYERSGHIDRRRGGDKGVIALCGEVRRLGAVVKAVEALASAVTRLWADLTSQEMYGESISEAIDEHDRDEFNEAMQALRAALGSAK